ncbi:hypothetical protein [Streptomyces sp. NBC_01637]|uniref:hypothetical protein n=1 Tax=unclassified Streptomyces TaxID=2593676 RepID=UPI00386B5FB8
MSEHVPETDLREFLRTRRARITPEQAGLPPHPGVRRVPGLRREEVAQLAGVSVDNYLHGRSPGGGINSPDACAGARPWSVAEAAARLEGVARRRARRQIHWHAFGTTHQNGLEET